MLNIQCRFQIQQGRFCPPSVFWKIWKFRFLTLVLTVTTFPLFLRPLLQLLSSLYITGKENQKIFWNYSRHHKSSWIVSGLAFEAVAGVSRWGFRSPGTATTLKTKYYIWGLNIQQLFCCVFTKVAHSLLTLKREPNSSYSYKKAISNV